MKKMSPFIKKKSIKQKFKLKVKVIFIRFINHISILNVFKNTDINFFLQEIVGHFFSLSLYFQAIIFNKY